METMKKGPYPGLFQLIFSSDRTTRTNEWERFQLAMNIPVQGTKNPGTGQNKSYLGNIGEKG